MEEAPAVGIDLGTTYSCIAVSYKGKVEVIPNEEGNRITPSYVAFTDREYLIGEAAKNPDAINPGNTIFDAKRLIGRRFDDPLVQHDIKQWPFEVINDGGKPKFKIQCKGEQKTFFPEQISALVLIKMKRIAEAYLGKTVKKAVISVPAYFNDSQRQATKDAGEIAGLTVLRIMNEPAAAALAYGIGSQSDDERQILIYDLGGGTCDVVVLTAEEHIFELKSIAGNTHLGGQDFDSRMISHFVKEFATKYGKNLTTNRQAMCRLRTACERAKRILSTSDEAKIDLNLLFGGIDFQSSITRARFEALNKDLIESTIDYVVDALKAANMTTADINEVVLVGGSSRIPLVQTLIKTIFGIKKMNKSIHPDEAVAYGAALQAAQLDVSEELWELPDISDAITRNVLINVTPMSLGINVEGGIMSKLIERNSRIPKKVTKSFTTTRDNQSWVNIQVYEGERLDNKYNNLIGNIILDKLPRAPRGRCQIDVCFEIDADSILNVTAVEMSSKTTHKIKIYNDKGRLSKEEIKKIIKEIEIFKFDDDLLLQTIETKNEIENYCFSIKSKLADPKIKGNMKNSYYREILQKCTETINWLDTKPNVKKEEYVRRLEELKMLWERRSSTSLQRKLSFTLFRKK